MNLTVDHKTKRVHAELAANQDEETWSFSLTSYKDELIFVTGGVKHPWYNSNKTKLIDRFRVFETRSNTFHKGSSLTFAR